MITPNIAYAHMGEKASGQQSGTGMMDGYGIGYGMMPLGHGGLSGNFTMILIWAVLVLAVAVLWKQVTKD